MTHETSITTGTEMGQDQLGRFGLWKRLFLSLDIAGPVCTSGVN